MVCKRLARSLALLAAALCLTSGGSAWAGHYWGPGSWATPYMGWASYGSLGYVGAGYGSYGGWGGPLYRRHFVGWHHGGLAYASWGSYGGGWGYNGYSYGSVGYVSYGCCGSSGGSYGSYGSTGYSLGSCGSCGSCGSLGGYGCWGSSGGSVGGSGASYSSGTPSQAPPTPAAPPEAGQAQPETTPPTPPAPPTTDGAADAAAGSATLLTVALPSNAQLYVNGQRMHSTGTLRLFRSTALASGRTYPYELRAVVERDGQMVTQTKTVQLRGGDRQNVDFQFGDPGNAPDVTTRLTLRVPADAKVVLAGIETSGNGTVRTFNTTKLDAGQHWENYTVEVSVERDGQTVTQERTIDLVGGEGQQLAFEFDSQLKVASAR